MFSLRRSLTTCKNDPRNTSSMEPLQASTSSVNSQRPSITSPMELLPHDFFNNWSGSQWAWEHPSFTESDTQSPESQNPDMQMFGNPPRLPTEQPSPNEG